MIPKKIHYCWFGGAPLPPLAEKCIASWKKFFPDWEIKEWNESNYDVRKIPYTAEAYDAKKYAFVSDYARFDILYQYGGIYFDVDVEVIKDFSDILENGGFMGCETASNLNAGLGIGCTAGLGIVYQILNFYASLRFINADGSYNLTTVVAHVTAILKQNGLKEITHSSADGIQYLDGLAIYPPEYFNPINYWTHRLEITDKTHSIHHYAASWISEEDKQYGEVTARLCRMFGIRFGRALALAYYGLRNIPQKGLKWFFGRVKNKVIRKHGSD